MKHAQRWYVVEYVVPLGDNGVLWTAKRFGTVRAAERFAQGAAGVVYRVTVPNHLSGEPLWRLNWRDCMEGAGDGFVSSFDDFKRYRDVSNADIVGVI